MKQRDEIINMKGRERKRAAANDKTDRQADRQTDK